MHINSSKQAVFIDIEPAERVIRILDTFGTLSGSLFWGSMSSYMILKKKMRLIINKLNDYSVYERLLYS